MKTPRRLRDVDTGDQAEQLRFTVMVLLPGMFLLFVLERMLWPGGPLLFLTVLNLALLILLSLLLWPLIHRGSSAAINGLLAGGGEAFTVQYSEIEALVVQHRFAEAADMYRAIAEEMPRNAEVRMRLGALLEKPLNDPSGAVAAFLAARQAAPTPQQEAVITNALIDLYRQNGNRSGMMAELSRFARLQQGSPAGEQAREAVRRMTREDAAARPETDY